MPVYLHSLVSNLIHRDENNPNDSVYVSVLGQWNSDLTNDITNNIHKHQIQLKESFKDNNKYKVVFSHHDESEDVSYSPKCPYCTRMSHLTDDAKQRVYWSILGKVVYRDNEIKHINASHIEFIPPPKVEDRISLHKSLCQISYGPMNFDEVKNKSRKLGTKKQINDGKTTIEETLSSAEADLSEIQRFVMKSVKDLAPENIEGVTLKQIYQYRDVKQSKFTNEDLYNATEILKTEFCYLYSMEDNPNISNEDLQLQRAL